ncbi:hypothetical protein LCGC14_0817130 [marine sediment metagenome]|uniref:Uncharacterized protein n=1 Tax=marine sediment metagenome TaxID=412755 RepID=A0A0F9Q599_9ZZZZ
MGLESFAELELRKAGLFDEDSDYEGKVGEWVIELVQAFAAQGHSELSANLTVAAFSRVAIREPLTLSTGENLDG